MKKKMLLLQLHAIDHQSGKWPIPFRKMKITKKKINLNIEYLIALIN